MTEKPRIRRVWEGYAYYWYCIGLGCLGVAETPEQAYEYWLDVLNC